MEDNPSASSTAVVVVIVNVSKTVCLVTGRIWCTKLENTFETLLIDILETVQDSDYCFFHNNANTTKV